MAVETNKKMTPEQMVAISDNIRVDNIRIDTLNALYSNVKQQQKVVLNDIKMKQFRT